MRGSGLTRYRPDNQSGGSLRSFLGNIFKDVKDSAVSEAKKEGWKQLKSGGPLGLPSVSAGFGGVKRGAIRGAKRGAKRKAHSVVQDANKKAKRAIDDLFG